MAGFRRRAVPQLLLVFLVVYNAVLAAGSLRPLSEADKESAKQLFISQEDGSYGSLEELYQAVRSLQALRSDDYDTAKITKVVHEALTASSPEIMDIFYGLRTIELLHNGREGAAIGSTVAPKVLASVRESKSLVDLYFSVGALATIKKHHWSEDSHHSFAPAVKGVLARIKALGESHGTWRYSEDDSDSSAKAAGYAFDVTAGVIEIAGLEGSKSEVRSIKAAVGKLFDNIELYEDGAQYFDESKADKVTGGGGALAASAMVLRGVSALASVLPDGLKIKEEKVFGLASFFLSIGTAGSAAEAYYQLDALSILEDNRLVVPLAVYLPTSVLSQTSNDQLEVAVSTVLGSRAPEVVVSLISASKPGNEDSPILIDQELQAVEGGYKYSLDFLSKIKDVSKYDLKLEVKPVSVEHSYKYSAGGLTVPHIVVTGVVSVSNVELAVLDSDTGTPESVSSLSLAHKETAQLSANHLQKLRLSFELTSPSGGVYRPQQVFFKLRHERGVEHLYLVKASGKNFELNLDFLGLVEKLYYLSGTYTSQLIVGDLTMENSFIWDLGSLDLELPDAPEGSKPPPIGANVSPKFQPKAEIAHIFRVPEKRPGAELSYTFLVLTLLPLVGFFAGLFFIGANVKYFPTSGFHLLAASSFHVGIAAILALYFLFWLQFDLFTTLKVLGFLALFTSVTGHYILSYLADLSSKIKTA
ncbi:unnamed protein product [Calypogeia fissa]